MWRCSSSSIWPETPIWGDISTACLRSTSPMRCSAGFLWQFLTYAFLHASPMHILFNMLFLWMFGRELEPALGSRRFLVFYLTGAVFSGILYILFDVGHVLAARGAVNYSGLRGRIRRGHGGHHGVRALLAQPPHTVHVHLSHAHAHLCLHRGHRRAVRRSEHPGQHRPLRRIWAACCGGLIFVRYAFQMGASPRPASRRPRAAPAGRSQADEQRLDANPRQDSPRRRAIPFLERTALPETDGQEEVMRFFQPKPLRPGATACILNVDSNSGYRSWASGWASTMLNDLGALSLLGESADWLKDADGKSVRDHRLVWLDAYSAAWTEPTRDDLHQALPRKGDAALQGASVTITCIQTPISCEARPKERNATWPARRDAPQGHGRPGRPVGGEQVRDGRDPPALPHLPPVPLPLPGRHAL